MGMNGSFESCRLGRCLRLILWIWSVRITLSFSFRPSVGKLPKRCLLATTTVVENVVHLSEDIDQSFVERQYMMPSIVERALLVNEESDSGSSSVSPLELLDRLDMSPSERDDATNALRSHDSVVTVRSLLTAQECIKLRNYVRKQIKDDGIDDVDGCPDWQVNLSEHKLQKIVGRDALERLWSVPRRLEGDESLSFERVGVFIRMYRTSMRPWMPFHRDGNHWTVNVALNDDDEYRGGRLLALHDNQLQVIERQEGDVTCHRGRVFHGVSAMIDGTRYSMILFFHADLDTAQKYITS